MRIIGGKLKGSALNIPKDKKTRPLKDLVRESIFNLLNHSNKISLKLEGSNILDLYSGTGSFGLECLSRDAKCVYFVENEKNAIDILKKNIDKLKLKKKIKIFFNNTFDLLKKSDVLKIKFNLVFCDPPFKDENIELLINLILKEKILDKNGIIILHRKKDKKDKLPDHFKVIEERTYGVCKIIFGKF